MHHAKYVCACVGAASPRLPATRRPFVDGSNRAMLMLLPVFENSEDRSMNTKIKPAISSGCAALALLCIAALAQGAEAATARREANGAIRYYDDGLKFGEFERAGRHHGGAAHGR